ncbi:MAG TPA: LysE family transporter [Mycobacteriales bacterium]|nr:LysE family transporter [Mycobacteriales bacterium]
MDLGLMLRGAGFGLAIAAPVGPIAVLLIRRTLLRGRAVGYASGLGAATADLGYGLVVALGLSAVTDALDAAARGLQVFGGVVLVLLGWRTARAPTPDVTDIAAEPTRRGLLAAYSSTLLLTLTNPATVVAFLAVFASVGVLTTSSSSSDAISVAAGVAAGSALWQLGLCTVVSLLRHRLSPTTLHRVNIGSGAVIAAFGVAALVAAT